MSGGETGFRAGSEGWDNAGGAKLAKQVVCLELLFFLAAVALSWRPDSLWWRLYLGTLHPQGYALAGLFVFSGLGLVRLLPEWPRSSDRRGWRWWIFTVAVSVALLALGFLVWPGWGPTE